MPTPFPFLGTLGTASPGSLVLAGEGSIAARLATLPGLTRLWKFDELSGTHAVDATGNSNGVVNGDVTFGWTGPDGSPCAKVGTGGYVWDPTGINLSDIGALYYWYQPTSIPRWGTEWCLVSPDGAGSTAVLGNNHYVNSTTFGQEFQVCDDVLGGPFMAPGNWYEVVGIFVHGSFSRLTWYINRQLVGSGGRHWSTAPSPPFSWHHSVGGTPVRPSAPGYYANFAVFSSIPPAGLANPRASGDTGSGPIVGNAPQPFAPSTANVLVTQAVAERLSTAAPAVRVSSSQAEVLRTGNYRGRVTQVCLEVLRNPANVVPIFVSASTGLSLGASGGITAVGLTRSVSVTTGLKLATGTYGHVQQNYDVSAATGIKLGIGTYRHIAETFSLSVKSGMDFGPRGIVTALLNVAGQNTITISVVTGFDFHPTTSKTVYVTQTYFLSASTGITVGTGLRRIGEYFASATTGLGLGGAGGVYNTRKGVTARTGFAIRAAAANPALTHTFSVSASTVMEMGHEAERHTGLALRVYAATAMSLSDSNRRTRDAVARATTIVNAGATAASNGRDIFVHAATSMGMNATDGSNQNIHQNRSSAFVLYATAAYIVTGTTADSGLVLTHLAQAEVSLPWRRASLTLPPGGQIPH